MNKIDIVITMAGLSSRFKDVGYTVPKYMIKAKGKTLFEWSLLSLKNYKERTNQYIFLALKEENIQVENFIKDQCSKLGIENYKIIIINEPTDGQATTAMLARNYWIENNSLLIYNIDTYVELDALKIEDIKGDGYIPCFKAEGTHWSFVRLNDKNEVCEIKEKEKISDNCTIGAYYFKTCKLFENLYNEFYLKNNDNIEKYVAPLYNHLLNKGGQIYISNIEANKVHVLGTPKELETFINV